MERKNKFHWAWIILITCFCNLLINYSARLGYGVVLPEMIRDLGLSRTAGGSIYNAYLLVYLTVTPMTGYLTDKFGGRRVITMCAFILAVGIFLMGTTTSLWSACLFFAITGAGATGMWTSCVTIVQRWFTPGRRGLALGLLSIGAGLGFAVTGIVYPWLIVYFNWRYTWFVIGIGALLMVLADSLLLKKDPESAGWMPWGEQNPIVQNFSESSDTIKGISYKSILRNSTFWTIGLSYLFISYSLYGITTFMVDYARFQAGLPLERASFLATVHGICQTIGVIIILPASDYLGRKKTIIISNLLVMISVAGILLSNNSWQMLYGMVGILAIFYGVIFPLYAACAGDYFPKEAIGRVVGAWTPFLGLGGILVHWVSGILRDATGLYNHAFLVMMGTAALGMLLMMRVKNKG